MSSYFRFIYIGTILTTFNYYLSFSVVKRNTGHLTPHTELINKEIEISVLQTQFKGNSCNTFLDNVNDIKFSLSLLY